MKDQEKSTILTLTGRAPVKILKAEWPVIASVRGDSWRPGGNGGHYEQALNQGELDKYLLRVRRHADGRVLVYGILDAASVWTRNEDWSGGKLLEAGADIAEAILCVGKDGRIPASVVRDCVADLPAEEI